MNTSPALQDVPGRVREAWPRMNEWFDSLTLGDLGWRAGLMHALRIEEFTKDGEFQIHAELPGIDPETDLEIDVSQGVLTIQGKREEKYEAGKHSEFYYGRFLRSVSLPMGAQEDQIKATYQDGILRISIPVGEQAEEGRKIPVTRMG